MRNPKSPQATGSAGRYVSDVRELKAYTERLARQYSWKLVNRLSLPASDREDIEQELHLALWLSSQQFDDSRGPALAFLRQVAKNESLKFVARVTAARRDFRKCVYLNDAASEVLVGACANPFRREERLILAVDVQLGIDALAPRLRRLAVALRDLSCADVARQLAIPKATLYRLIGLTRTQFKARGLEAYIDSKSQPQRPGKESSKRKKMRLFELQSGIYM